MVKTMEYMALGTPGVAFDLPETRLTAQDAALYARPNDVADFAGQIATLLDDDNLRLRMGEQAAQHAKKCNREHQNDGGRKCRQRSCRPFRFYRCSPKSKPRRSSPIAGSRYSR